MSTNQLAGLAGHLCVIQSVSVVPTQYLVQPQLVSIFWYHPPSTLVNRYYHQVSNIVLRYIKDPKRLAEDIVGHRVDKIGCNYVPVW